MDGSDRKSISSSSNLNKQRPLIPKGIDENGKIYLEHDKQSRTTTTRHFMSPTISAASKFNPSRKRILGERNVSFDNLQKIPNLDSKSIPKPPISDLNRNSCEINDFSDDSSSKPYDPITNYLCPRPRFLRYKPNRRRLMLLRRENQEKEGQNYDSDAVSDCDSSCSCGSLSESQSDEISGSVPESKSDEISDSDDEIEFEEVEDGRGWSFRGAFKVLMVLFALVISTLYICSMNSPTPSSSVVLAVSGIRDGFHLMQNHVYEYVNQSFLFSKRNYRVIEEEEKVIDVRMEEVSNELKEENDGVVEIVEDGEGEEEDLDKFIEEDEEIVELDEEGEEEVVDDDTFDEEILEQEEEEEWNEIIDLVDGFKIPDFSDSEGVVEIGEVSVFEEVFEEPSSVPDELEKEGFVKESIIEGIFERERVPIGNLTDEVHKIGDEGANNMIKSFMQIELVLKALIGFFTVLSSIIISRVLLRMRVHSRKSRIARENPSPTSPPVINEPCFESVLAHEEQKNPIETATTHFGIPRSLMNELEEASKGIKETSSMSLSGESRAAPIIELLGELELSEMSTSLRSCGIKNSKLFETEVSSLSISMEKTKIGIKPVHVSTFNSLSYPNEKKQSMKKKEREGGNTEGKNEIITPVRRSSRIKNRALSP